MATIFSSHGITYLSGFGLNRSYAGLRVDEANDDGDGDEDGGWPDRFVSWPPERGGGDEGAEEEEEEEGGGGPRPFAGGDDLGFVAIPNYRPAAAKHQNTPDRSLPESCHQQPKSPHVRERRTFRSSWDITEDDDDDDESAISNWISNWFKSWNKKHAATL
jgi:hypothetical protein